MIKQLSPYNQYRLDAKQLEPHELLKSGDPIENVPFGAVITSVGLYLPQELNADQWQKLGQVLTKTNTASQWNIGDWWCHGGQKFGKKARKLAKELPYEFGSLMNLGSVARKVKPSSRNEALSFSHHVVVAKLDADDQVKWLAKAQRGKLSVSQLRQRLYEHEQINSDDDPDRDRKLANNWAFNFEMEAQKATSPHFYSDEHLKLLNSATVRSLAECPSSRHLAQRAARFSGERASFVG